MAVFLDIRGNVLVVLIFADNKLDTIIGTSSLSDNAQIGDGNYWVLSPTAVLFC